MLNTTTITQQMDLGNALHLAASQMAVLAVHLQQQGDEEPAQVAGNSRDLVRLALAQLQQKERA